VSCGNSRLTGGSSPSEMPPSSRLRTTPGESGDRDIKISIATADLIKKTKKIHHQLGICNAGV
jgi:hypothetical protein